MSREGIGFLTKALPRLDKAFTRALTGEVSLDSTGFRKETGSKLPRFLGKLFKRVFTLNGWVLPDPCVGCVAAIHDILALFYKLELPYDKETEQEVISKFIKTDDDILDVSTELASIANSLDSTAPLGRRSYDRLPHGRIIAKARRRVSQLFRRFNPKHIVPSHGPGAVSTKEKLWDKWRWRTISPRIAQTYPIDEYFYTSLGHVCDDLQGLQALKIDENSARVVLVPKDSRGPRLISCEPLEVQRVQQGLSRAIVKHVESHPLTRWNINFTNQQPNQFGALLGSRNGKYCTLDLKEASDRISLGLVHLLFGGTGLLDPLLNCRSLATELPGGEIKVLNKYAPMGSALCFPVLAVCVWAILSAGAPDAHTRKRVLVYGDDVIVPTAFAENAIELLESFGLLVNRDKSCTKGFFRESCGVDAFRGKHITPVRIRTVWSSSRCPHVYASWIAYANAMYDKRYYAAYEVITARLVKVYGEIPDQESFSGNLCLRVIPEHARPKLRRVNPNLHRLEYKVWGIRTPKLNREIDGWMMLLRFFTEGQRPQSRELGLEHDQFRRIDTAHNTFGSLTREPFSVRSYTKRKTVKLRKVWQPLEPTRKGPLKEVTSLWRDSRIDEALETMLYSCE